MPIVREHKKLRYSEITRAQKYFRLGYTYGLSQVTKMLFFELTEKTKKIDLLRDRPKMEALLHERAEEEKAENTLEQEFAPLFLLEPFKVTKRAQLLRPRFQSARIERDLRTLEELILASPMSSSVILASGPVVVKKAIERSGFLEEAQRPNSELAHDLLSICVDRGVEPGPDQFIACVSFYVFGIVELMEALDYVICYASRREREIPTGWAAHFATHALKILTQQVDRDDRYFFYDTAQRRDAINRALRYLHPTAKALPHSA